VARTFSLVKFGLCPWRAADRFDPDSALREIALQGIRQPGLVGNLAIRPHEVERILCKPASS